MGIEGFLLERAIEKTRDVGENRGCGEIPVMVGANLIVQFDISDEQIADVVEVPVDVVKAMRDELTKYADLIYPGYINDNKKSLPKR